MSAPLQSAAPLRGTQSFVGVMSQVFRRPLLTGIEVLWRWAVGAAFLLLLWHFFGRQLIAIPESPGIAAALVGPLPVKRLLLAVAIAAPVWIGAFATGRRLLLRKLGSGSARWPAIAGLTALRTLALSSLIALWLGVVGGLAWKIDWSGHIFASQQNLVGYFALAVVATLMVFIGWSLVSWRFWLPIVVAAEEGCGARQAWRLAGADVAARGKLIEINLVMGIVKVALLVLALVFSACPLPFSSVETREFLMWWWSGVAVFYLVASDYFHVVRQAAYLELYRAVKELAN